MPTIAPQGGYYHGWIWIIIIIVVLILFCPWIFYGAGK